jgi:hypothetical protein
VRDKSLVGYFGSEKIYKIEDVSFIPLKMENSIPPMTV